MAIVYGPKSGSKGGRRLPPCCADCAEDAGAGLAELAATTGHRGARALAHLGRAHRAGGIKRHIPRAHLAAGLGDIDMSSFVVSQSAIDAESEAFDGRLNAWMLDYETAAARLPPSFVQQVDDFIGRWRKQKDSFYFFQTSRLTDLVNAEAEFNRLRDQFLSYGQTTAIAPATVTAGGKTVRSDQIPADADWFSRVRSIAIWGGVIVGGVAAIKISSDLGLFRRLGSALGPREHTT